MSKQDRKARALLDFVKDVADGAYNLRGIDAHNALELLQRRAIQIRNAVGKVPCGECHLKQNETCDICGAKAASK